MLVEDTGIVKQFLREDNEGLVIETRSNIAEALMERNKRLRNSGIVPESQGMRYVGSVDPVIYERWCKEDPELRYDVKKLYKKLKDPEYSNFLVVDKSKL